MAGLIGPLAAKMALAKAVEGGNGSERRTAIVRPKQSNRADGGASRTAAGGRLVDAHAVDVRGLVQRRRNELADGIIARCPRGARIAVKGIRRAMFSAAALLAAANLNSLHAEAGRQRIAR